MGHRHEGERQERRPCGQSGQERDIGGTLVLASQLGNSDLVIRVRTFIENILHVLDALQVFKIASGSEPLL
jgi:hypothetical protein